MHVCTAAFDCRPCCTQGDCEAALSDLELAEESFDLCQTDLLGSVDNVGLLLLDSVWCLFKLQDSARLAAAQVGHAASVCHRAAENTPTRVVGF